MKKRRGMDYVTQTLNQMKKRRGMDSILREKRFNSGRTLDV